MQISFAVIFVQCLILAILSYIYNIPFEKGLFIVSILIFIHLGKGIASGFYVTSNMLMLHHIGGPKLRRRAVFIAPFIFQLINSVIQLIYPYLTSYRYVSCASFAVVALTGLLISTFLEVHLLHEKKK